MQESYEKKIRQNLIALVDLTNGVQDVVKSLRDKDVLSGEDEDTILRAESPFDQKSQLYWTITKKDDSAFDKLVETLKSTGNDQAADKLLETSPSADQESESPNQVIQAEVFVESHKEPDQEGIDFAEEIEREFERIQTEQGEDENEATELTSESFQEISQENEVDKELSQLAQTEIDNDEGLESEVKVEITPPESEPEETEEVYGGATEDEINPESPKVELVAQEEEEVAKVPDEEEDKTDAVSPAPEPTYALTGDDDDNKNEDEPVQMRRQVQFDTYTENGNNNKNGQDDSGSEESTSPGVRKSIVQLNKEKFEKNAPAGVKVKYSFRKEEPVETPKESTVKNLRNFFQKLSSVDNADATPTKQGTKLGGIHPNRKSMAS